MIRNIFLSAFITVSVAKLFKCTSEQRSTLCIPGPSVKVCGMTTKGIQVNFGNVCSACSHADIITYSLEECKRHWGLPVTMILNKHREQTSWLYSPLPDENGESGVFMNDTYNCSSFGQFCFDFAVCSEKGESFRSNCEYCKNNKNSTISFGTCDLKRITKPKITDFLQLPQDHLINMKQLVEQSNKKINRTVSSNIIPKKNQKDKLQQFFNFYYPTENEYEAKFEGYRYAQPSGPWYTCPQNISKNCIQRNIVVCGSSSTFQLMRSFVDYCVACAYEDTKYFAVGRCPPFVSAILRVTNKLPANFTSKYMQFIRQMYLMKQSQTKSIAVTQNVDYFTDTGQYFQFMKSKIIPLGKLTKIYILQQRLHKADKQAVETLRIQCKQKKVICEKNNQPRAVCGIFSYGYNRTFENACAACKHPNVIAYTLKICEPNNYTIIQYSIVAGINETGEECNASAKAECDPKEEKMKLCGMTKSQRLVPYSNHSVCEVCKIKTNVRYFKKDCNLVSQRVISSPKQQAKQYDSFLSFSWNEVKPGYSLQLERGKTMACSQQQRTSECVKRQEKPPPVCGYWGRNMYRTYSSECEACSEVNVGSYSYGECPKEGSVDVKKTNAPMQEFQCRGPLRSVGTCSLRKDPVCYQAPDGSRKSYINNCVACHSESNSPNFTIGGGCYGTDFSMKAVILKMLEIEQHMIQTQQNVEMM